MKKFLPLALIFLFSNSVKAQDNLTNITIYGNSPQTWNMPYYSYNSNTPGYAILTFAKQLSLVQGNNLVEVKNIPQEVDSSSIMVKNLGRGQQLLEQNFYASKKMDDLVLANIGKQVEIEQNNGGEIVTLKGTLLDTSNGIILQDGNKTILTKTYSNINISAENAPDIQNSLKWLISSPNQMDSILEYSYKTNGITWGANYNVFVDGEGADLMASIEAWASLINSTNININPTNLKLVAGEVFQAQSPEAYGMQFASRAQVASDSSGMQQEKFSDYYIYTIDRKVELPARSSKNIKLFPRKDGVIARKKYMFDGSSGDNNVKSIVTFTNDERSRLGVPMPAGKYRVFAKDKSGEFEQIGEATQEHKAENEKVELAIGNSFDLKATRKQMSEERDELRRKVKYSVIVEIENALDEEVEVIVKERIYQPNWSVISGNFDYKKSDVNTAEFTVRATAKETTTLEYVVQYSW